MLLENIAEISKCRLKILYRCAFATTAAELYKQIFKLLENIAQVYNCCQRILNIFEIMENIAPIIKCGWRKFHTIVTTTGKFITNWQLLFENTYRLDLKLLLENI